MNYRMKAFLNPRRIIAAFVARYCTWLPESLFLRIRYQLLMGKRLNLKKPSTFNEKIQWLKLHDRKPIYSIMVDKLLVKEYISNKIGEEYVIPTLGCWDKFDDINFALLPNEFVLKSSNGGGGNGVIICKDKKMFDYAKAKKVLELSLQSDASKMQGEWVYKDIKPRIIAERLIKDTSSMDLKDYKFFCFNGKVRCFKIDFGRFEEHHANYYDPQGNVLYFGETLCPPVFDHHLQMPTNLPLMIKLAEKISDGHIFLRVDLYNVDSKIYFGECTFYPNAGFGPFIPEEWDQKLGEYIQLSTALRKDAASYVTDLGGGKIATLICINFGRKEVRLCA